MARGINKVILVGNLGNDPETKYTQGGMAITTLSVATTAEYLKKGRQVYIEGRIEYGSYEKDGVKHYTTDILCDDMQMLGGGGEGRGEPRSEGAPRPARPQRSESAPRRDAPAQRPAPMDDFADDDIPF